MELSAKLLDYEETKATSIKIHDGEYFQALSLAYTNLFERKIGQLCALWQSILSVQIRLT